MEAGIRPALDSGERHLQALIDHFAEEPEESDEVTLARPIGANQHVQRSELEVFQLANGFKTFYGQRLDLCHRGVLTFSVSNSSQ